MLELALKIALSPVLVTQALLTRSRLPRLAEARGARRGVVGTGPELRLLVAGDSSAAGVGVARQQQALAAQLARELARLAARRVHWQLLAESGLTTAQMRQRMQGHEASPWDLAVVVTGVNDVVDQIPSHHAVGHREAIANQLRNRHGVRHVAFAPLPPVDRFPGLPQPLRWVAGADARRHNRALQEWVRTRADVSCVPIRLEQVTAMMAGDGFHPGERAYRQCAQAIARHLNDLIHHH